ncbi:dephospho-CoA kinase [Parasphingorhabdus marina DSM 22363]|uniref:Dephospho-CoA kinase n=1 Tax=Parasphingorhabdus marina DSM 22363 TaxID=1123272 RepID=A0A1N6CPB2_9SPHN|nr:dephospho-CoA kinase [Parasphingorhabdus marina]SIN60204.1 dephospho-CoA kinase [Parasphingorhabdus marina DSM 22363]
MTEENNRRPLIIGLTGSIGMGKSTVAEMFADEGVPVFDADAAVHILQGPGGALVEEIESLFPGTTGPEGVDRQKLGAAVLGNREALSRLEQIIHPAVGQMRLDFLSANSDAPLILFDIPLLFEKTGADGVDHIVVVSASEADQEERVLARPNMTREKFEKIKSLQMPDAEKRKRADSVIDTSVPLAETRQQVQNCVQKLKASLA